MTAACSKALAKVMVVLALLVTTPFVQADAGQPPEAAPAEAVTPAPTEADGPVYLISRFEFQYTRPNPAHVPLEELLQVQVRLGSTDQGYIAPRPDVPAVTKRLIELDGEEPQPYYASAVQHILVAVRDELVARHYLGIYVAPDPLQIDEDGKDLRPQDQTQLRIIIITGTVTQVRTLAHGDRIDPQQRVDHPLHARIRERSPIRPSPDGDAVVTDLIRKDVLDEYVLMLSRHPGRRVDVALSPASDIGGVSMDYLITETKPWLVYAQLSNTGTRNTQDLRQQFGFRHYQLTNNDDILSFDYVTASFDDVHAVTGSYESRLGDNDRVRWGVFSSWSKYTASDVGIFSATFSGESFHVGGELIVNLFQSGPLFIDAVAGGRYEHIEVFDTLPGSLPGSEGLFIPYATLRAEHVTDFHAFHASATLELQSQGINNASTSDLARLGRVGVDDDWAILRWGVSQSFFLEPLLNRKAWEDPSTPRSSTLAHELFFSTRGQHTFNSSVIPQYEMVAGGLHTVRGYDESVVAGDTVILGTAEYRFHLPKALGLEPEPRQLFGEDFRLAPQQVYGPTDWDFILRGFIDAGHVVSNAAGGIAGDSSTLVGAGVGFEVQFRRNVTFSFDWGVALNDIPGRVSSGSSQVHFLLTVLY